MEYRDPEILKYLALGMHVRLCRKEFEAVCVLWYEWKRALVVIDKNARLRLWEVTGVRSN